MRTTGGSQHRMRNKQYRTQTQLKGNHNRFEGTQGTLEAIDSDKEGEDLITSSLQKLANLRKINAELFDTPASTIGNRSHKQFRTVASKEDDIVEQMISDVEEEKEEMLQ